MLLLKHGRIEILDQNTMYGWYEQNTIDLHGVVRPIQIFTTKKYWILFRKRRSPRFCDPLPNLFQFNPRSLIEMLIE
uniref:Orf77 n=1 Tax=Salvadora persica TaxID=4326 RepID=A0A898NSX8_SALPE|nr:hypothetical chloroplast RF15 [Salvadora persica]YP_010174686.1 hypothetical chloroplast RF15 [Salvadora persica]QSJ55449.1 hypothetical chloroplast RF15 [Salvadora persica]QSJ55453.1 hypothetical chloroplast RF15 [Salvadora persica]